ncbi:hypothetical protein CH373_16910 [Leptospira perolatii]|uniref:Fibronectin type-III domain-containing protein n=2 Tax=Leptospira perolatii TaxID=2023191 RepID=A0A2M9ZIY2_9LEPT|nr:hypothetical protein CH360_16090 [Leptospira perolatii]PJZ71913.1 hypothetical protein CH373_16910 [Leptospira perolatii]
MRRCRQSIPYIAILLFLFGRSVFAEEREFIYYIEWKEVKGSRGYLVEVRKSFEEPQVSEALVLERKVQENEIEFKVASGVYEFRIAALNRFGKPSAFTAWTKFKVEQDRPKAVAIAEKEGKQVSDQSFVWVPGWGFYKNDQKWKASAVWLWFGVLGVVGNSERMAGNRLADDSMNDPKVIGLLSRNIPTVGTFALLEARNHDKAEYHTHQQNQALIGGIAILSLAYILWWENRSIAGSKISLRVVPEIQSNAGAYSASSFLSGKSSRIEMTFSWSY